jgi:hypothetical protein
MDEHTNEFTYRFSRYACDLVIGPCTLMQGVVVSDEVMSSSGGYLWHPCVPSNRHSSTMTRPITA